ncbi:Nuclear nucleic acid-binding protein C1D [Myotis brandtii]|uniref:Nuclear nucleic acid-binding protein C1D n=1 Tax=Myotis brandtii TaxID=109478 RepID=S7NN89_MYOBR|nr:Nuclear nucleic acid-binding protein C1D [Myotis brandtii]
MAEEEINEDYQEEIHEYLSAFENSIGAVDDMLKTMMSVSRNELLQKERIRVYMNRVKEITDKKKAAKLDKGAASRFVKNAFWVPKPKNESKVASKGKSKK